ncbi:hypothetical protein QH639_19190 [Lysinibacillus sp. 1 U-2021]|nr:hypothetical protein [Lysinibacillus sp. 1 U-2021]WGT37928.1 hypothetical protein QH639_19190 [Lysinibacillus sp. 1 U-2021]
MWNKLYKEMYVVKLNGFAIVGWIAASVYGCITLIKELVNAIN